LYNAGPSGPPPSGGGARRRPPAPPASPGIGSAPGQ